MTLYSRGRKNINWIQLIWIQTIIQTIPMIQQLLLRLHILNCLKRHLFLHNTPCGSSFLRTSRLCFGHVVGKRVSSQSKMITAFAGSWNPGSSMPSQVLIHRLFIRLPVYQCTSLASKMQCFKRFCSSMFKVLKTSVIVGLLVGSHPFHPVFRYVLSIQNSNFHYKKKHTHKFERWNALLAEFSLYPSVAPKSPCPMAARKKVTSGETELTGKFMGCPQAGSG